MPKLKILSGQDIVKELISFGFVEVAQKGSHIKMARITADKIKQTLTIPNHPELDKGTIKAIYRQTTKYISETELHKHFYH